MIRTTSPQQVVELDRTIDMAQLVSTARDAGVDVMLIERPMPDAVSVAGLGRRYDIVSTLDGAAVEDSEGLVLDHEGGPDRVAAAARLWSRLSAATQAASPGPAGTGLVGLGGFAFDPSRDPGDHWAGFPSLLFRVPALAVTRVRGRTFATGDLGLLDQAEAVWSAPPARHFEVEPVRPESDWTAAVAEASRRMRAGAAAKVVLAREVVARADGVLKAGQVAGALRRAHPSSFTFLIAGADGSAFVGASPELLLRRSGRQVVSQPMAGTTRRGEDESEDEILAGRLRASAKDGAEHRLTARHVADSLTTFCEHVDAGLPEIVRLTTVQHLATTISGRLREPAPSLLEMAAVVHPTPAVNGAPAAAAQRLICELECMERGWYAGAVGWLDGRGDGELAVAIRCGLLCEEGARLFAGNGMMPDSDPEAELEETRPKLRVLLGALAG
jgi:salicylate biosynthesis isochorismate synthase/menaquinone-specific isochorismate synthase